MQAVEQQEHAGSATIRDQLTALLAGCGVHRADRTLLSLSGRDRVRWLNGMVSNSIRDLGAGEGVYAFVLTPQGHIQADLYAFNRGESLLVETDRAQGETVLQIFRKYIIMDKVEIQDLSDETSVIALTGPRSAAVLSSLYLNANLAPLQISDVQLNDSTATLVRGDNSCVPNYELLVPAQRADSLCSELLNGGALAVGDESLEMFRILCGTPKVGQDIRERTLPQETGQDRALNFSKGCYIGQEIVERIRARGAVHRAFTGFEVDGPAPVAGTKIQSEGKDVGELTTVAAAPLKAKLLALGFLRKEFMDATRPLTAGDAKVKPVSLPFRNIF
jgi:aminomethyltransferase